MPIAHHHRCRRQRLSILAWCVAMVAVQVTFSNRAEAQWIEAGEVDTWTDGHIVLLVHDFFPGDYEIWVGEGTSLTPTFLKFTVPPAPNDGKGQSYIIRFSPNGRPTDSDGKRIGDRPKKAGPYIIKKGNMLWVRPIPARGIGTVAPNRTDWDTNRTRIVDARWSDLEQDLHDLFYSSAQPPGSSPTEPLAFANLSQSMNGAMQVRTGYAPGTVISITVNPMQASFVSNEPAPVSSSAEVTVNHQMIQIQFSEYWDFLEDRSIDIGNVGVEAHAAWVEIEYLYQGEVQTYVTFSSVEDETMSFSDTDSELRRSQTVRIAHIPNKGDTNGDQRTNVEDLLEVIYNFGQNPDDTEADCNLDGAVNVMDILEVIYNWNNAANATTHSL